MADPLSSCANEALKSAIVEVTYDRDFGLSPLAAALDRAREYGAQVVKIWRDWTAVFAPRPLK